MQSIFLTLFFLPCFSNRIQANDVDQQIYECICSPEFSNTTLCYPYKNAQYPIQIIHNPNGEILWGRGFETPLSYLQKTFVKCVIALSLLRHIHTNTVFIAVRKSIHLNYFKSEKARNCHLKRHRFSAFLKRLFRKNEAHTPH